MVWLLVDFSRGWQFDVKVQATPSCSEKHKIVRYPVFRESNVELRVIELKLGRERVQELKHFVCHSDRVLRSSGCLPIVSIGYFPDSFVVLVRAQGHRIYYFSEH